MSAGEWIAFAALVITTAGGIGGFIYWAADRNSKFEAEIETNKALRDAIKGLTSTLTDTIIEMRQFRARMESWQEHVDSQLDALWRKHDGNGP